MQLQKSKCWKFFASPFTEFLPHFVCLLFLTSVVNIVDLISKELYPFAFYVFTNAFLTSYVFTLPFALIKNKYVRWIYRVMLSVLVMAFFVIDLMCHVQFHTRFSSDIAAILLGTNINEANEFLDVFVTEDLVKGIVGYLLAAFILFVCFHKVRKYQHLFVTAILMLFTVAAIGLAVRNPMAGEEVLIGKLSLFFKYEAPEDLHRYMTNPSLIVEEDMQPENVVVIIGESFSKFHSSLYQYNKDTNPRLSALQDNLSLYVFKNVEAPATNTIPAFKCILNTYKPEYGDSIKWFACTTVIEVLQKIGYHTSWFSNQSKKGIFDNEVGKFADLCDEDHFVGNKFAGMSRTSYDGLLIDMAKPVLRDGMNACFFHLMGSHEDFKNRYPETFNEFKAEDYADALPNQRQKLAEYDNSILYNDFVVSEIISMFRQKEAIVFYFSDHGLDVFNSSDDYCAHAIGDNEVSAYYGKQIPFMIYVSDLYREKHPDVVLKIDNLLNEDFRTDDFIYLLMDLIGVSFAEGER